MQWIRREGCVRDFFDSACWARWKNTPLPDDPTNNWFARGFWHVALRGMTDAFQVRCAFDRRAVKRVRLYMCVGPCCSVYHSHPLAYLATHLSRLSRQPFANSNYSLTVFMWGIESLPSAFRGSEDAQLVVALMAGPHEASINHFHRIVQFFVDELKLLMGGVWMKVYTSQGILEDRLVRVRSHFARLMIVLLSHLDACVFFSIALHVLFAFCCVVVLSVSPSPSPCLFSLFFSPFLPSPLLVDPSSLLSPLSFFNSLSRHTSPSPPA